jgi:hypothetical protein
MDFISCSRSTICSTYGFSSFDTLLILNPQDLQSDFSDNRVEGAPSSPLRFVNPVRDSEIFTRN